MERYRVFLDQRRVGELFQAVELPLSLRDETPTGSEGYPVGHKLLALVSEWENPTSLDRLGSIGLAELLRSSSLLSHPHTTNKRRMRGLGVRPTMSQGREGAIGSPNQTR